MFAWNALPGEIAEIETTKEKEKFLEGVAVRINARSAHRVDPQEDHFLSCSPWQIMTLAYENHWKKEIAKETYKRIGGLDLPDLDIVFDDNLFGYRNKAEYAFCVAPGGDKIRLAVHERGTTELRAIDTCLLAKAEINKTAVALLALLNKAKARVEDLKSLILRENGKGLVVATLIVVNEDFRLPPTAACDDTLRGLRVYFTNPKRGPRLRLLESLGDDHLEEELAGKRFKCAPLGFFQINIDIFAKTLRKIGTFIESGDEIVDFYSGVGAIGIALGDQVKSCVLVENDREASGLAKENIEFNELRNFTARRGSAESMLSEIERDKTIIFDPPRAGLHPKVVAKILDVLPGRVIYLSCDTATQARDLKMLSQKYGVTFCELYNFFPRTPHIETLVILERA